LFCFVRNEHAFFPPYEALAQNRNTRGLPELLNLTPQPGNLITYMHCYTMLYDAGAMLLRLV
jgi:hypothetical protein